MTHPIMQFSYRVTCSTHPIVQVFSSVPVGPIQLCRISCSVPEWPILLGLLGDSTYLIHYLGPLLLWSWMTHQFAGVPRWPILLWRLPQVFLDEQSFYECYAYLTVSTVQYSWMTHSITKVTLSIPRWPFLLFRLTQVFLDDQPYYEGYLKYSIPVPPILLFRPPLVLLYDPAYCEKVYRAVGAQPIRPGFQSLGNRLFTKQNLKIEEKVLKREGGNVTMYIALLVPAS